MAKLAVGIITYQDRSALERCLNSSLYDNVDVIIVVDGRYPEWGTEDLPQFSTDGIKEYCQSLDKVDFYELFADQNTKRDKYLIETKKHNCDFLLVVDADDYVYKPETDWDMFRNFIDQFEEQYNKDTRQMFMVPFIVEPGKRQNIGRLFYKPYQLHYITHWRLIRQTDNKEVTYWKYYQYVTPGLVMTSDDLTRPKSRLAIDIEYQWTLAYKEGSITLEQYNNPLQKIRFANSIINEVAVWEEYYNSKM